MSIQTFKKIKCGDLISDNRGIVYVVTQRLQSECGDYFKGVTLDNNTYNSQDIHSANCCHWSLVSAN